MPVSSAGGGLAVGDLDQDGRADVATGVGDSQVAVLRGKPDGGLRRFKLFAGGENLADLAISDLDDDGDLDLAGLGGQVRVLINQVVPTPRAGRVAQ